MFPSVFPCFRVSVRLSVSQQEHATVSQGLSISAKGLCVQNDFGLYAGGASTLGRFHVNMFLLLCFYGKNPLNRSCQMLKCNYNTVKWCMSVREVEDILLDLHWTPSQLLPLISRTPTCLQTVNKKSVLILGRESQKLIIFYLKFLIASCEMKAMTIIISSHFSSPPCCKFVSVFLKSCGHQKKKEKNFKYKLYELKCPVRKSHLFTYRRMTH